MQQKNNYVKNGGMVASVSAIAVVRLIYLFIIIAYHQGMILKLIKKGHSRD